MNISPYFRNLRTAYVAELDDLTSDSEGNNILGKRMLHRVVHHQSLRRC